MKATAAATAMLLLPQAALSHSSPLYTSFSGPRAHFPATFLATVPSHTLSNTKRPPILNQRRRVAVIRGGAAVTAEGSFQVPPAGTESGDGNKGSSVSTATFNLIKNILGAGVLSLPSGVGAFSSNPMALVPAVALTMGMGSLSAYCFTLIARVCALNKVETYGEAWEKSVGKKTAWMVPAACTFKTFCACTAFSIIIADSFSSLFGATPGFPALLAQRTNVIVWMTSLVLLPLCMLKSFAPLAPFSLLGILGTVFTGAVIALRLLDGSYAPGGQFHEAIAASLRPSLLSGSSSPLLSPMVFVLVSMLSTSFIAHYNAPKFYTELENRSIPKLNKVVQNSFNFCTAAFAFIMGCGYLTFGGASQGLILNNYAEQDVLAKMCRLAIGASIVFGYPLTFVGIRDGVLSLLGRKAPSTRTQTVTTLVLLAVVSTLAVFLRDVGFVVSLGGALLGSCIIYIFPAIIFIKTMAQKVATGEVVETPAVKREVLLNKGITALGVLLAIIGATVSVLKAFILK